MLLALCSGALYGVYQLERGSRYARSWLGLAVVFLAMSVDETVPVHELIGDILQETFSFSGFLYFAWVIPGAVFALTFAAVYLRFLLRLPAKTRYLILGAGGLYVAGALEVEVVIARYVATYGNDTLTYAAMSTLEEGLELLGASLFLYTLLAYLARAAHAPLEFTVGTRSVPVTLSQD